MSGLLIELITHSLFNSHMSSIISEVMLGRYWVQSRCHPIETRIEPRSACDWRLKHERPIKERLCYAWTVTHSRRNACSGKALSPSTRETPSLFNVHRFSNASTARRMNFSRGANASLESRKWQISHDTRMHTQNGLERLENIV